jgi:hypothetical protein
VSLSISLPQVDFSVSKCSKLAGSWTPANGRRNVQTVARYRLVLDNSISLDCKVSTRDLLSSSIFQKHSRRGGEGEKESTAKTKRPSKNTAAKFDVGTASLIG